MRIGAQRRVGPKNSRDCDDRIVAGRSGDNRAVGEAQTLRLVCQGRAARAIAHGNVGMIATL